MSRPNHRLAVFLTLGIVSSIQGSLMAGPKVVVGRLVPADQRVSIDSIGHSAWNLLVRKYVDDHGNVDYTGWKGSRRDVQALDDYLSDLSRADRGQKANQQARLAMWINAYNAVTVRGILREYPTKSIKNHTAILYGYNIWKDLLLQVGGQQLSLDQIEHEILRKMREPRIHFAIVCASRSCPKLMNTAYTADNLEQLLTQNTRDFFADPANFRFDSTRGRMYLSSILDWFGPDFGKTTADRLRAIAPYLPDEASQRAAESGSVAVSFLDYDWSLNDQKSARTARRSG